IGKPERSRWREFLFGSVVDDLIRRSGQIDIYVIRGSGEEDSHPRLAPHAHAVGWDWSGFAWAVAIVAATTAIGWPLHRAERFHIAAENILMLYLLGVLWIATHHSRAAAVLASILSVAAFDLIFVT